MFGNKQGTICSLKLFIYGNENVLDIFLKLSDIKTQRRAGGFIARKKVAVSENVHGEFVL